MYILPFFLDKFSLFGGGGGGFAGFTGFGLFPPVNPMGLELSNQGEFNRRYLALSFWSL